MCVGLVGVDCAVSGCVCLSPSQSSSGAKPPTGKTCKAGNSKKKKKRTKTLSTNKKLSSTVNSYNAITIQRGSLQHHLSNLGNLFLTHLQHGVQHMDLASLLSSLRQSEALRWSHPGDPLDHSLHPGELHQHILILWTQALHTHCIVSCLTHHLWDTGEVGGLGATERERIWKQCLRKWGFT